MRTTIRTGRTRAVFVLVNLAVGALLAHRLGLAHYPSRLPAVAGSWSAVVERFTRFHGVVNRRG